MGMETWEKRAPLNLELGTALDLTDQGEETAVGRERTGIKTNFQD